MPWFWCILIFSNSMQKRSILSFIFAFYEVLLNLFLPMTQIFFPNLSRGVSHLFSSHLQGFPCGPVVKILPANARDMGLIPRSGRSSGGGNGKPLRYSFLKNALDRGAQQPAVHRAAKSRIWLSSWAHPDTWPQDHGTATWISWFCGWWPAGVTSFLSMFGGWLFLIMK